MKKIFLIISLFLGFISSSQSYKIIGNDAWIDAMFYFEVTDSHNGAEMRGIKVQMFDGGRIVATTYTNNRGRALFMFKGVRDLESDMHFKIQKENYAPWSKTLGDQWDVLQFMKRNQIGIRYKNNQGLNRLRKVTSRAEDLSQILNGNFEKFNGSTGGYGGTKFPGMMQFQVSLSYDRHPSERRGYNSGSSNGYNNNSNNSSSQGSGRNERSVQREEVKPTSRSKNPENPFAPMGIGNLGDNYNGWILSASSGEVTFSKEGARLVIENSFGKYSVGHAPKGTRELIYLGKGQTLNIDSSIQLAKEFIDNYKEQVSIKTAYNGWELNFHSKKETSFVFGDKYLVAEFREHATYNDYIIWEIYKGETRGNNLTFYSDLSKITAYLKNYMENDENKK